MRFRRLERIDMRTMYSDGFEVAEGEAGLTLQFNQSSGKAKSNPVSRIGMSYEQAERVITDLQKAMLRHKFSDGKSLPLGDK